MDEQRQSVRDITLARAVRVHSQLPNGVTVEGSVADVSDGGVKVIGETRGVIAGDEVLLTLLLPMGQRVMYRCKVKHVDPLGQFWGGQFASAGSPAD